MTDKSDLVDLRLRRKLNNVTQKPRLKVANRGPGGFEFVHIHQKASESLPELMQFAH